MPFSLIVLLKNYWKPLLIGIAGITIVYTCYHWSYKRGAEHIQLLWDKSIHDAEERFNAITAEQEKQLSELRTTNSQLEEKVQNETQKDVICSDKPMPDSRVSALTKRTSAK